MLWLRKHGENASTTGRTTQREQTLLILQRHLRKCGLLPQQVTDVVSVSSAATTGSVPQGEEPRDDKSNEGVDPRVFGALRVTLFCLIQMLFVAFRASALIYPSQAKTVDQLTGAFELLKKIEVLVSTHKLTG